ncbi:Uncharacterized NAD(P)/FAD-binding protein YdhS [Arboricoccus pini]|uniref:Uncharacterized NAD(P)/FAD-binding protein YdhS n=1 Tax=Arboricoccus pini TaxID=1963835 RepID=A0A212RFT8_9PROT|nr:FAD/NAD(P)-binding protein [Arboricoccus pini]SNB71050.1 Uncharacterized NAD(P)/FAD-binding protein YdhS [Arboricoccus pini]
MQQQLRRRRRIVIVGGGFSGAVLAIHLARRAKESLDIKIVEPRARLGSGLAYSTTVPDHFMNAPSTLSSIEPEDPHHLSRWLEAYASERGLDVDAWRHEGQVFTPRWIFGRYIEAQLNVVAEQCAPAVLVRHVRAAAAHITRRANGTIVHLSDGRAIVADQLVLAFGATPGRPDFAKDLPHGQPGYLGDPWREDDYSTLAGGSLVLLAGTGLTMADAIATLEAKGYRGRYLAISRRGIRAFERRSPAVLPSFLDPADLPTSLTKLWRQVRAVLRDLKCNGGDWQSVVPVIRAQLPDLWRSATAKDKQQFLRHLRRIWEMSQHRLPPPASRLLDALAAQGRLEIKAGRIQRTAARKDGRLGVAFKPRGGDHVQILTVDGLINCTGAQHDLLRATNRPFVQNLLASGHIRPGPFSFGLDVHPDLRVLDAKARPQSWLFAVGAPVRGVHWESNGVSELLSQVVGLADRLAARADTKEDGVELADNVIVVA